MRPITDEYLELYEKTYGIKLMEYQKNLLKAYSTATGPLVFVPRRGVGCGILMQMIQIEYLQEDTIMKRTKLNYFWSSRHWTIIPTIMLCNYTDHCAIQFVFLGLQIGIIVKKRKDLYETLYGRRKSEMEE